MAALAGLCGCHRSHRLSADDSPPLADLGVPLDSWIEPDGFRPPDAGPDPEIELVERLHAARPDLPVLYVSGFSGPEVGDLRTLAKPFSLRQLVGALLEL